MLFVILFLGVGYVALGLATWLFDRSGPRMRKRFVVLTWPVYWIALLIYWMATGRHR